MDWDMDALTLLKNERVKSEDCLEKAQHEHRELAVYQHALKKHYVSLQRKNKRLKIKISQLAHGETRDLNDARHTVEQELLTYSQVLYQFQKRQLLLQFNEVNLVNRIERLRILHLSLSSNFKNHPPLVNHQMMHTYLQQLDADFPLVSPADSEKYSKKWNGNIHVDYF